MLYTEQDMEQYLVIDLEFCRTDKHAAKLRKYYVPHEVMQIGAVILNEENEVVDSFRSFVHPQFGMPDEKVSELTGITEEDLKDAPLLQKALASMAEWIGGRKVIAASWSDTDYRQLSDEMSQKHIHNRTIEKLFDDWVDLQKAYTNMVGSSQAISLEKAMNASSVEVDGRLHDGAVDAFNTAKLISSIRKQEDSAIEIKPIHEDNSYEEDMGFTLGSAFANIRFN